ncbi:sensor histidine kinase [Rubrivirga sp.]|uniref:sensor histidine kinase n=1 Tax=Rubrivirga sp. TaxID=1885344 RepID=UPI003C7237EF
MSSPPVPDPPRAPFGTGWIQRIPSIRAKLALIFGVLVVLVTVNTAAIQWGVAQRAEAFGQLRVGIDRVTLLRDAHNRTDDRQVYFDLLSALSPGAITSLPDFTKEAISTEIDSTGLMVADAVSLLPPPSRARLATLRRKVDNLGQAWDEFMEVQREDPARARVVLDERADPLARRLIDDEFPAAIKAEEARLDDLSDGFLRTSRQSRRDTWIGLAVSTLLGGLLAFVVSRDVLGSVRALRDGADALGAGDRSHRVRLDRNDELGKVADAFDTMADRLDSRTSEVEAQRDSLTSALGDLQTAQERLVQQAKLASLGELTAGIAHEIKNPLNFVTNFSSLNTELTQELRQAVRDQDRDEVLALATEIEENAGRVHHHSQRADGIVRSMLQHSRGTPGERVRTDVNRVVDEYVGLAFHGVRSRNPSLSIEVVRELGEDTGAAVIAPGEIGRVVVNLVGNALDSVTERAALEGADFVPTVWVKTYRDPNDVVIRVSDNGVGLEDGTEDKVLQPFFTTKPTGQGTGLGLSLSYEIVTRGHGGTLAFVPTHEGAAVEVRIPHAT